MPAFELIDEYRKASIYRSSYGKSDNDAAVYMTSQSCMANCSFCPTHSIHGKWRAKSTAKVIEELNILIDTFGFKTIQFYDDDFLLRKDLNAILAHLKTREIEWTCFTRADNIDLSKLMKMKSSGLIHLFIGVESGSQEVLDYYKKNITVQTNSNAIAMCDLTGVRSEIGIIFGAPIDTLDTIKKSLDFILDNPVDYLGISILSVNPGTLEWKRAKEKNKFKDIIDEKGNYAPEKYGKDLLEPLNQPAVCENLSKQDLNSLVDMGYALFYLRDSQIARLKSWNAPELDAFLRVIKNNFMNVLEINSSSPVKKLAQDVHKIIKHREV